MVTRKLAIDEQCRQAQEAFGIYAIDYRPPQRSAHQISNRVVFGSLQPIFRDIVLQYVTPNDRKDDESGLKAMEKDFAIKFGKLLLPGKGRNSLFRNCCIEWGLVDDVDGSFNAEDSNWILHVVLTSLLQGVIKQYADYLSRGSLSESESPDSGSDVDHNQTPSAVWQDLERLRKETPSESVRVKPTSVKSLVNDHTVDWMKKAMDRKWQGRLQAAEHVWENFSLALAMQRGDQSAANWVAKALKNTTGPKKAQREQALKTKANVKDFASNSIAHLDATTLATPGLDYTLLISEALENVEYPNALKFSAVLMDLALEVLRDSSSFEPPLYLTENTGRDVRRIKPSESVLRALMTYQARVRLADTSGPLKDSPRPWTMEGDYAGGIERGGLYNRKMGFYKFHSKNKPIKTFLEAVGKDTDAFGNVFDAVNALQQTTWRINQDVWTVLKSLISLSDDPDVLETRLRDSVPFLKVPMPVEDTKWKKWLESDFFARSTTQFNKRTSLGEQDLSKPGWRLISPLGAAEVMRLESWKTFHFAYNADSRGRIYATGSYIQPQGEDVFRALLEFNDAKKVTPENGGIYLALHGSQCASREKILIDLNIRDRLSPTNEERIRWIRQNSTIICKCAEEPLSEIWWRQVGGRSAFQFLAFCFAWRDVRNGKPIRLPVQVDGTCNGLQHIAALTGSKKLAGAVNLLKGGSKEGPKDIYLEVANAVKDRIKDTKRVIFPLRKNMSAYSKVLASHELKLREMLQEYPDLLNRTAAKEVVMIIPYGATVQAYKDKLAKHIGDHPKFNEMKAKLIEIGDEALIASKNEALAKATARAIKNSQDDSKAEGIKKASAKKKLDWLRRKAHIFDITFNVAPPSDSTIDFELIDTAAKDLVIDRISLKVLARDGAQQVITIRNAEANPKLMLRACDVKEREPLQVVRIKRKPSPWEDDSWKPLSYGKQMMAALLAHEFETTLIEQYPVVQQFKDWLQGIAKQVAKKHNLPISWVSPSGFPVLQNAFKKETNQIDIEGITSIRMSYYAIADDINPNDQITGILPNFIHSLDGAHLVATILKTKTKIKRQHQAKVSFSMIHDSFGTHAEDMNDLTKSLREAFIELHSQNILEEFRNFMESYVNKIPKLVNSDSRNITKNTLVGLFPTEGDSSNLKLPTFSRVEGDYTFDLREVESSEYFFS